MAFIHIVKSLLWGIVFQIIMHIWNFRTVYVFLDNTFIGKESNKYYHFNMIPKHAIRNTTLFKTT
jgi:hypothetical protein